MDQTIDLSRTVPFVDSNNRSTFGDVVVVWGGVCEEFDGPLCTDAFAFSLSDSRWVERPGLGSRTGRVQQSVSISATGIHVFGGKMGGRLLTNGMSYDPETDRWEDWTTAGEPSPRAKHFGVVVGDYVVVWGGEDELGHPIGDGARYDLRTKTWRPMATHPELLPASSIQTAVVDGQLLMIDAHRMVLGSLAFSYDPVADEWQRVAELDDLTGVHDSPHVVSNGTEALIWPTDRGFLVWNGEHRALATTDVSPSYAWRYLAAVAWLPETRSAFVWGGSVRGRGELRADGYLIRQTAE